MPYSATPPMPAMARSPRSSRSSAMPLTDVTGTRVPLGSTPDCAAGRPQPDHRHAAPRRRPRDWPREVERVPARQQRIDLEAPGQAEHILQRAGLDLRDVDRFLLLVDAGLHAVVADAMSGCSEQRIINHCHGKRTQREALALEEVHLRDLFLERAAGERDAERRLLELGRLAVAQPPRAAVL